MDKITKKYIFECKLKGEPITIPWSPEPWLETIKHLDILVECGILEEGDPQKTGRFIVRYPVIMYGSRHTDGQHCGVKDKRSDHWTTLNIGARIAEPGDVWDLR